MGGDFGPSVTVPASLHVLQKREHLRLILVGDRDQIDSEVKKYRQDYASPVLDRLETLHTTQQVGMDELPSQALRMKKDSSMRVAVNQIKEGRAQASVSAGNTGALMAIARFVLKTLPGVDRPAIIASLPTVSPDKEVRVLDLGANVDSSADHLFQFAVMGSLLVSALDNIKRPRVGLLNIGEEEIKGNDQVKHTAQLLTESDFINYIGYIEGNDIFSGEADVIVCDGFVGNVALKTLEGSANMFVAYAKRAFNQSWLTRFAAFLAQPALKYLKKQLDPGRRNGASLIGLQGIVIKSHGGAGILAFANAIKEAVHEVEKNIPELIRKEVGIMLKDSESEVP